MIGLTIKNRNNFFSSKPEAKFPLFKGCSRITTITLITKNEVKPIAKTNLTTDFITQRRRKSSASVGGWWYSSAKLPEMTQITNSGCWSWLPPYYKMGGENSDKWKAFIIVVESFIVILFAVSVLFLYWWTRTFTHRLLKLLREVVKYSSTYTNARRVVNFYLLVDGSPLLEGRDGCIYNNSTKFGQGKVFGKQSR